MSKPERADFTSATIGSPSPPTGIIAPGDRSSTDICATRPRAVVDDDHPIAESLSSLLAGTQLATNRAYGPTLVAIGADLLAEHAATILLESHSGEFGDATSLIRPLVDQGFAVVALTADPDPVSRARCLDAGAVAVLLKGHTTGAAMRHAVTEMGAETPHRREHGAPATGLQVARGLRLDVDERFERLTPRESDVLRLLGDGLSAADIAERSYVALATVRSQIRAVLAKVEVSSQIAAVAAAHRHGWFDRPTDDPSISSIVAMPQKR